MIKPFNYVVLSLKNFCGSASKKELGYNLKSKVFGSGRFIEKEF
jgi:hypothetical protein